MNDYSEQIKEAVKGNAFYFGSNRELRRLPEYLHEGEQVVSIITGSRRGLRGRGIVVATNERIIFIWDGWVFRENQDYPYETISSVEFKTGIFFGTFVMYGKGDETAYNWVGRVAGAKFAKKVRELVAQASRDENAYRAQYAAGTRPSELHPSPVHPQPVGAPTAGPDLVLKQIEELGALRDKGYISLDDYEIKKQELLSRL